MKDLICIVVGLIGVALGAWQMYAYVTQSARDPTTWHLILAIIGIVIAVVCGIFFMLGRVNKQEEIHITK